MQSYGVVCCGVAWCVCAGRVWGRARVLYPADAEALLLCALGKAAACAGPGCCDRGSCLPARSGDITGVPHVCPAFTHPAAGCVWCCTCAAAQASCVRAGLCSSVVVRFAATSCLPPAACVEPLCCGDATSVPGPGCAQTDGLQGLAALPFCSAVLSHAAAVFARAWGFFARMHKLASKVTGGAAARGAAKTTRRAAACMVWRAGRGRILHRPACAGEVC
jgi:hypothetical protein